MMEQNDKSTRWLEPGFHRATIASWMEGRHQNGAEYIRFTFEDEDGRIVHHSILLNGRTDSVLKLMASNAWVKPFNVDAPNWDAFIGKPLGVMVVLNEQGYPTVKRWERVTKHQGEVKIQTLAEAMAERDKHNEAPKPVVEDDLMELLGIK